MPQFFLYMAHNADIVAKRVASGGHHIPEDTIRRRYSRGLSNFFTFYLPLADTWTAMDNTGIETQLVAQGGNELTTDILLPERWHLMESQLN